MLSLLFQFSTNMTLINKPECGVKMGLFTVFNCQTLIEYGALQQLYHLSLEQ